MPRGYPGMTEDLKREYIKNSLPFCVTTHTRHDRSDPRKTVNTCYLITVEDAHWFERGEYLANKLSVNNLYDDHPSVAIENTLQKLGYVPINHSHPAFRNYTEKDGTVSQMASHTTTIWHRLNQE